MSYLAINVFPVCPRLGTILCTFLSATLLGFTAIPARSVIPDVRETGAHADLDRDGLDDEFEQELLHRFAPRFLVSARECDGMPAEFLPDSRKPLPVARNGTIYGQVFPAAPAQMPGTYIEIRYYHLWTRDCGRLAHDLDVEHVSALLRFDRPDDRPWGWRAVYWYAAAHEGTVCDVSNAAHASALDAEERGPAVWISAGKHASFLSLDLCRKMGCGGDHCDEPAAIPGGKLLNLGEPGAPLNQAVWAESNLWPLADKMKTDFEEPLLALLAGSEAAKAVRVGGASPPVHAVILAGDSILNAVETGNRHTGAALADADAHTGSALGKASGKAGRSLRRAWRAVLDSLQRPDK